MSEGPSRGESSPEGRVPDGRASATGEVEDVILCEVCGAAMHYTAGCKIQCFRCGYARDCSDP